MITATIYTYYNQCLRKMWLHHHQIVMEHTSELVAEGKLLHETSYPYRNQCYRELQLPGVKMDHYDPSRGIVHEIKKSPKRRAAHLAQIKFYLWTLEQHELPADHGILEYPQQRKREKVWLNEADREEIRRSLEVVRKVLQGNCPQRLKRALCKSCSYVDFCWSEEKEG
ncbi:MAG: CRISPR-associated protein Cas4 [Bacteroidota bacterium]